MRLGRVVVGVALWSTCLASGGCSILFAKGAPTRLEPHEPIRCTRSYALPGVDVVIAAVQGLNTALALALSDQDYKNAGVPISRTADIVRGSIMMGVFAVSAGVGYSRVGECNELIDKVEGRPEPRRRGPPPDPWQSQRPPGPDPDADLERAAATAGAEDAKAAGAAAARSSQTKPAQPASK
jgi:hypothetical protein